MSPILDVAAGDRMKRTIIMSELWISLFFFNITGNIWDTYITQQNIQQSFSHFFFYLNAELLHIISLIFFPANAMYVPSRGASREAG